VRNLTPSGVDGVEKWLAAAIDTIPRWIEFQMRLTEQPGCAIAVSHRGKRVLEFALGHADLPRATPLTPRHRFRVASHSKTFTAAGVLKLREQGRVQLDDPIGRHVAGLHRDVARLTLTQLLSHSAGLVRDGRDAGQWTERRPFLDEAALRADLADGPTIDPNTRFKYSNHGYGLVGLAIEAITGEPFGPWIAREIVAASGLRETLPDAPALADEAVPTLRLASGHSSKLPLGQRVAVPAAMTTNALAAATGFISTAADLAQFMASLSPTATKSVLSVASRRELVRRQWRDPHATLERWYGLGTISGTLAGWDWFGHSGGFPGTVTRSACVPAQELALSVLTNAVDGPSHQWLDGCLRLLQAYARHGPPSRRAAAWSGRWWSLWGATDLLPMGDKVMVANPALQNPLQDASEIVPAGRRRDGTRLGRIELANGFASHGEPASLEVDDRGRARAVWLGGTRLLPEAQVARALRRRYLGP
jgi:D-alanyl-D-alanine carboxypeptidase